MITKKMRTPEAPWSRFANLWVKSVPFSAIAAFGAGLLFGYARIPSVIVWGIASALLIAGVVLRDRTTEMPKLVRKYSLFVS